MCGLLAESLLLKLVTAPIAGSVLVGFIALCTLRWHRNETRRKALSEMLRSYIKAAQQLKRASDARLKCERIAHAFSPRGDAPEKAPASANQPAQSTTPLQPDSQQESKPRQLHIQIAQENFNQLRERYTHHINEGMDAFTNFEAEYAANKFRFGRMTNVAITEALQELSKLGEAVNAGNFGGVETRVATIKEFHGELNEIARRLGSRSLRSIFAGFVFGHKQRPSCIPIITREEMEEVFALVHKRATTQAQATFKVYPPQYQLDHPDAINAATLCPEIACAKYFLLFQDGSTAALSLTQLVVFTHQLLFLAFEHQNFLKQLENANVRDVRVKLEASLVPEELMKSENRRAILDKIEFATESSESMQPDNARSASDSFATGLRFATRAISDSPGHSLWRRDVILGRWTFHLFSIEDRNRRNERVKRIRKKLRDDARNTADETADEAVETDYPAF